MDKKKLFIIGIDEAGRGPLAGPVVVAGVKIVPREGRAAPRLLAGIKDSKKLSASRRAEWFLRLTRSSVVVWAVAASSPRVIDRINIARAADRAALRVWKRLAAAPERADRAAYRTLVDAGIRLADPISYESIIKGDERVPVIAAASIIAKVTRDRIMLRLHRRHPRYRFDLHKGYGTALHRALIRRHGMSDAHRKSFSVR